MYENFAGKNRRIVVAVNADSPKDYLPEFAANIAARTGMTLRLLHVIEYTSVGSPAAYPDGYVFARTSIETRDELIETAIGTLNSIKSKLQAKRDIVVEINTAMGSVAENLQAEAVSTNASLLICGAKATSHRFVPKGLSTALGLMSDSPKPVIVVPEDSVSDFSNQYLTILASDDLTDNSAEAVTTACELAVNLGNATIAHLHIHPQTRKQIEDQAQKVIDVMLNNEVELEEFFARERVFENVTNNIKAAMSKRVGILNKVIDMSDHTTYRREMRFGDIVEQFGEVVDEVKPDLLVFGRHQFVHRQPWSLGKMPFYGMLNLHRPVMIVGAK